MSCKVGNQTNSQDPQAVNSRVFVGNLNTFQCSKTDVERRFQRYGRIAGISMHKGYAFIQFTNPFDARSACLGEDARFLWGQTLDVNMVAEPKSHQTGRKRQNVAKTGNDWDYYYDSYYAQVGFPTPRLVPPMKRPRIHLPPPLAPRTVPRKNLPAIKSYSNNTSLSELKSYSTPDILICGNCRELFSDVEQLMEHKKSYCKLRFTCKCHTRNGCTNKSLGEEPASLLCSQCKDSFHTAWDLMVHVQAAHMLNIYQLGGSGCGGDMKTGSSSSEDQTEEEHGLGIEEVNGLEEEEDEGEGGLNVNVNVNSHGGNHNSENNSSSPFPPGVVIEEMMSTSHGHSSPGHGHGQGLQSNGNGNVDVDDVKAETPEGRNRKNQGQNAILTKTTTTTTPFTFPMEVATQTQTQGEAAGGMDNPNNFDCGMESTLLGTMGVQFPYAIASTSSPLENKSA